MEKALKFSSAAILVLGFVAVTLAGCSMLDGFFGVDPANPAASDPSAPAPSDGVGGLLGTFGPWGALAGGVLGLLRWGYVEVRKRRLDGSFKAVVGGVKEAVDAAKGEPVDKTALYGAITAASNIYANREFFKQAVDKVKAEIDKKRSS